jgi:PKD repeat protein
MRTFCQASRSEQRAERGHFGILLAVLLGFAFFQSTAQVTSYDKYIFVSGQITDAESGAPIPDHEIFIFSDSTANNGFSYYALTKTDVNGFYWDTVETNLGDGILNLSIYDFEDNLISIDRYFRFVWETEYQMFVDFSIFDPYNTSEFQANFGTEPDTLVNDPLKVIFRDKSMGETVKAWRWDFGDGSTSQIQDPEHLYASPGNYLVTLSICSHPSFNEFYEISTITKQVQVGLAEFYHMGGHVFAQYFPIDLGLAYLYAFDQDDNLIPIDTTEIDTLGYYWFYQVPEGKYITKARLQGGSSAYGSFVPTYYGNVINWQQASLINLDNNNFELNVTLIPSMGINSGNGKILGQISYDTLRSGSTYTPAGDIEIVLLDDRGKYLTCGLSDIEGYFMFANIAFGTYQLFPDVAGTPTTPIFVTITEEEPTVSDLSLVIHTGEVTFSIDENTSLFIEKDLRIYPNPARDEARLAIDMKKASAIQLRISDQAGRTIYLDNISLQAGPNQLLLDTRNFPAGYYLVTLVPEDRVPVSGKLLKFN